MSAFIPVAPDRWAEMVQASAEVGPLRNKVSDLKTELALKDVEIDRLKTRPTLSDQWKVFADLLAENDYLKSQINRLQPVRDYEHYLAGEIQRLKAEIEWLRKADRLVCWNADTQEWQVRFEAPK